jgi:hypothetical protein
VQVIGQAAVFFTRGTDQSAQFGFEEHVLRVARTKVDDEGYSVFWKLDTPSRPRFPWTGWFFLGFALGHVGRDSTPTGPKNPNPTNPTGRAGKAAFFRISAVMAL